MKSKRLILIFSIFVIIISMLIMPIVFGRVKQISKGWSGLSAVTGNAPSEPSSCVPSAGLISWWKADGNALDSADNNPGTPSSGVTYQPGKYSQAFELYYGDNIKVLDSPNLNPTKELSIVAWIKPTTNTGSIVDKYSLTGGSYGYTGGGYDFYIGLNAGILNLWGVVVYQPPLGCSQCSDIGDNIYTPYPSLNQWHHVVFVVSSTELKLYIDGNLAKKEPRSSLTDLKTIQRDLYLGSTQPYFGNSDPLNGLLDEVRLYNRALTDNEVMRLATGNQPCACGNGLTEPSNNEQCDDGNVVNTDNCKNDCSNNICGDGVVNTGVEQCDDGNIISDDGCSSSCIIEPCKEWTRTYNGALNSVDEGHGVAADANNVHITGYEVPSSELGTDIWTRKMNLIGNEIWTRTYDSPGYGADEGHDIAVDQYKNIHVIGTTGSNIWVQKMDTNGNEIWTRTFSSGSTGIAEGHGIAVDASGNIYSTGIMFRSDTASLAIWINKMDKNGNTIWTKYGDKASFNVANGDIAVDINENVYVISTAYLGSINNSDIWINKMDKNGNTIWTRTYNGPASVGDNGNGIAVDARGNVYVTGHVFSYDKYSADIFVQKMDTNGNEIWTRIYDNEVNYANDIGYDIALDTSGNVYVTGQWGDAAIDDYIDSLVDIWTRKIDPNGDTIWTRQHNGPAKSIDIGYDIALDTSDNIYVTGFELVDGQSRNIWTRKYCNSDFCIPKTCNDVGYECGTLSDGCGGILNCGSCLAGESCQNNNCASCNELCTELWFSSGTCRATSTACTQSGEKYQPAGDILCTGGSQADTCCCKS